jgi:hypothetical protein
VRTCDSKGETVTRRTGERTCEFNKWYLQPLSHICDFTTRACAGSRGGGQGHPQWIGECFGHRSNLAATVAGRHKCRHFHVRNSRPAKEDETKRGEGDRDGCEGDVRGRQLAGAPAFFYKSAVAIYSGQSAMADDIMRGLAGTDKESDGKPSNARDASESKGTGPECERASR